MIHSRVLPFIKKVDGTQLASLRNRLSFMLLLNVIFSSINVNNFLLEKKVETGQAWK